MTALHPTEPLASFTFSAPGKRLTMNERIHWAERSRRTADWRHAALLAGRALRLKNRIPRHWFPPCAIRVTFGVPDRRRRDPHNTAPTVKAIVDGLVDAGFWRDDTPDQVVLLDPVFERANPTLVKVELWPVSLLAEITGVTR